MKILNLLLVLFISLTSFITFAAVDEEEDYESIVSRLSAKPETKTDTDTFDLDNVMFHLGLGFSHSAFSLANDKVDTTLDQAGFNLMLGIDLFTPQWSTEVAYINYYTSQQNNLKTGIQEFDFKVLYKNSLSKLWGFRVGAGLAARYLTLEKQGAFSDNYTTPESILAGGFEVKLTPNLSIISEVSMKNALVSDTPEKRALDFILRIDGHL